jgi:hypothetical protein
LQFTTRLVAGLHRLNPDISTGKGTQVLVIWTIVAVATASVVSGVKVGIRRLSELNWILAQLLLFYYLFSDDTFYLLNNFVQSMGFYVQNFILLGSTCNTFDNAPVVCIILHQLSGRLSMHCRAAAQVVKTFAMVTITGRDQAAASTSSLMKCVTMHALSWPLVDGMVSQ